MAMITLLLAVTVKTTNLGQAFYFPDWADIGTGNYGVYLNLNDKALNTGGASACYSLIDGWAEREMCRNYTTWSGSARDAYCEALGLFKEPESRNWAPWFNGKGSMIMITNAAATIASINENIESSYYLLPGTGDLPNWDWRDADGSINQTLMHGVLVQTGETGMKVTLNQQITRKAYGYVNSMLSDVFESSWPTQAPFSAWASVETSGWPYTLLSNFNLDAYGDSARDHSTFDGSLKKSAWNRARAILPMMGDVLKDVHDVVVVSNVMNDTYSVAEIKGEWTGFAGPAWDEEKEKFVFNFPALAQIPKTNRVETVTTNIEVLCSDKVIYDIQNANYFADADFICMSTGYLGENFMMKKNGLFCVLDAFVYYDGAHHVKFVGYNSRDDETMGPPVYEITGGWGLNPFQMMPSGEPDIYHPIPITNGSASAVASFSRNVKYIMPDGGYYDTSTLPSWTMLGSYLYPTIEYVNLVKANWYEDWYTSSDSPYENNPWDTTLSEDYTTNAQWRCGNVECNIWEEEVANKLLLNAFGCKNKLNSMFNSVRGGGISQYCRVDISDARAYWNSLAASVEKKRDDGMDAVIHHYDAFFVFDSSAGGPVGLYIKDEDQFAYTYVGMNGPIAYSICGIGIDPTLAPEPEDRGYENRCWFHGVGTWDQRLRMNMDWKNYKMQAD